MFSEFIAVCCLLPASLVCLGLPAEWLRLAGKKEFCDTVVERGRTRLRRSSSFLHNYGVYYPYLLALAIRRYGGLCSLLGIFASLRKQGLSLREFKEMAVGRLGGEPACSLAAYRRWIERFDTLTETTELYIRDDIASWKGHPRISVLMPVYNTRPAHLQQALNSILNQLYPHWELCIADDCSPNPKIRKILEDYQQRDERIKVCFRTENGRICAASNTALDLCTGDFTALMDHDGVLPGHALYHVAKTILQHPEVHIVYSDEDRLNSDGSRYGPYFKCGWNEDLLLSQNYIGHLGVYRTSLLKEIGGFQMGCEGAQDYDLLLRCVERSHRHQIIHIPKILYHCQFQYSPADSDRCTPVRQHCVQAYLDRKKIAATVVEGFAGWNRVIYALPEPLPGVSCIVPFRDQAAMTEQCVEGLLSTDYDNLEILLVDNGSTQPEALALYERYTQHPRVRIIRWDRPFNYSEINNMAALQATGDYLALINNDVRVIKPDWLKIMVSHAAQPQVGAVGAKLLFADGTIQHAGVGLGLGRAGVAGHLYYRQPAETRMHFDQAQATQQITAVTGACLVLQKQKYFEVGAMNESELRVVYNDVDLCLKLHSSGYKNIYSPYAVLHHLESISRGYDVTKKKQKRFEKETEYMKRTWKEVLVRDMFINPNISKISPWFECVKDSECIY